MSESETFIKNQDKLSVCVRDYNRYVDSLEGQRNNLLKAVEQLRAELSKSKDEELRLLLGKHEK